MQSHQKRSSWMFGAASLVERAASSSISHQSTDDEDLLSLQGTRGNQAILDLLSQESGTSGQQGSPKNAAAQEASSEITSEPVVLRPAEATFQEAKSEGSSDAGALLAAMIEEPKDTLHVFGEAFVDDELRSFVGGMDIANDLAGLSPNPQVQTVTTFVTQPLANLVDIIAGAIRGDTERIEEALVETAIETTTGIVVGPITKAAGIKTDDARVSPWLVNSAGGISKTAAKTVTNNAIVSSVAESIGDKIKNWFGY